MRSHAALHVPVDYSDCLHDAITRGRSPRTRAAGTARGGVGLLLCKQRKHGHAVDSSRVARDIQQPKLRMETLELVFPERMGHASGSTMPVARIPLHKPIHLPTWERHTGTAT